MARRMDSFPFKIAKLQGYVFDNLEVDENGAARVVLTRRFWMNSMSLMLKVLPLLALQAVLIASNLGLFS